MAYVALGLVAVVVALARQREGSLPRRLGQALLALVLWPFLLPVLLAPGDASTRPESGLQSERARRLEEVMRRLDECWKLAAVENTWAAEQAREHRLLDGFASRMRAQERRLVEMETALASAATSVKERLTRMHEHAVAELEHNIGLAEELAAQLTLLHFSDLGNPSAVRVERGHIEELLQYIEALAEAAQPGGSESPPAAQAARGA